MWDAIEDVGMKGYKELKDEVYPYLNDPFSEFRADAVKCLGWSNHLGLPEFKEKVCEIWRKDPDERVKRVSLNAMSNYYFKTHNIKLLKELYDVLISKDYSNEIKSNALDAIMSIAGAYTSGREEYEILELGHIKDNDEFNRLVNWDIIHKIMKNNVPDWNNIENIR